MTNKYYKITNWKGHKNYECLHCEFSTLDQKAITKHIEKHIAADNQAKAKQDALDATAENYQDPTTVSPDKNKSKKKGNK